MKGLMTGSSNSKENEMKPINKADLYKKTDRELAGLAEEFRKSLGHCEQQRRKGYAAQADIRTVKSQRRILRPNL
jgi:hypothetical protein